MAGDAEGSGGAVITADTLTESHVRFARDAWPEHVTGEMAAFALGLPELRTSGGLPIYAPARDAWHARTAIANLIIHRQAQRAVCYPSGSHTLDGNSTLVHVCDENGTCPIDGRPR